MTYYALALYALLGSESYHVRASGQRWLEGAYPLTVPAAVWAANHPDYEVRARTGRIRDRFQADATYWTFWILTHTDGEVPRWVATIPFVRCAQLEAELGHRGLNIRMIWPAWFIQFADPVRGVEYARKR